MVKEFKERPALNLGPLCYTLAVKEGGSEICHVDPTDDKRKYAIIICLGEFSGGDLCLPFNGYRIPFAMGQILIFQARLLPHMTSVYKGFRLVITGFTTASLGCFDGYPKDMADYTSPNAREFLLEKDRLSKERARGRKTKSQKFQTLVDAFKVGTLRFKFANGKCTILGRKMVSDRRYNLRQRKTSL